MRHKDSNQNSGVLNVLYSEEDKILTNLRTLLIDSNHVSDKALHSYRIYYNLYNLITTKKEPILKMAEIYIFLQDDPKTATIIVKLLYETDRRKHKFFESRRRITI